MPLIEGKDGNFYGTTVESPGVYGLTLKIVPPKNFYGTLATIYTFGSAKTDGYSPTGWLARASDGNLYGVTNGKRRSSQEN
jgi:hypothetical protein